MNNKIVQTSGPVLLVGGGECPRARLIDALAATDRVVAADGGAAACLDLGRMPDAVIGDMDSLPEAVIAQLPDGVLHRIAEQDSTDFDKCLRNIEAPLVLGHGFLGARLDHQLAAMTVLVRRADTVCVLVGADDVVCVVPPRLALTLEPGTRVSLFPMGPVTGRSTGLRWPIDGLGFAPGGRVGTSNEALGEVVLDMDGPQMLLILPVACQNALVSGLADAPRWPVAPAR